MYFATECQSEEVRCRILRLIYENPGILQRELSDSLGVSIEKVNYLLRSLKEKGLVKAGNFMSSKNKTSYLYLLTPKGIAERVAINRLF